MCRPAMNDDNRKRQPKKRMNLIWRNILVLLACVLIVNGCANHRSAGNSATQTAAEPPLLQIVQPEDFQWSDPLFKNTFQNYWTLRKYGNATASWTLEAPYIQDMVIKGRYMKWAGVQRNEWQEITVLRQHQVSDHLFYIEFNMIADAGSGETKDVFYRDFWIHYEGQWVHVIKDMFLTEI